MTLKLTLQNICPEESSEGLKNRGCKGSVVTFSEFVFFSSTLKIVLQNLLVNWQTEGVNNNYRSPKFEEISEKKTGDISSESAFFPTHKIRHKIGICRSEASFFARFLWLDVATRPYYINYNSYTVNAFRVLVENGLEDVFFLHFSLVSIQFDIS